MYLLKRRFGTRRIHANVVYQEYVSEREHIHMNSTKWETLTEFVKWLGREGHCTVDETPKGWFITYIDKDPEVLKRQKAAASKEKHELDDQERLARFVAKQVEKAKESGSHEEEKIYTEFNRDEAGEKVQLNFSKPGPSKTTTEQPNLVEQKKLSNLMKKGDTAKVFKDKSKPKRKSALDEILEEEEEKKKKMKAVKKENWLTEGIVVKIITKKLGDKFYKKKCVVKEVKNLFIAIVELTDGGDTLKLDQMHLETVLPAVGKPVKIVNGNYRGCTAEMVSIDEKSFSASVKLKDGRSKGETVSKLPYEDICKLAVP